MAISSGPLPCVFHKRLHTGHCHIACCHVHQLVPFTFSLHLLPLRTSNFLSFVVLQNLKNHFMGLPGMCINTTPSREHVHRSPPSTTVVNKFTKASPSPACMVMSIRRWKKMQRPTKPALSISSFCVFRRCTDWQLFSPSTSPRADVTHLQTLFISIVTLFSCRSPTTMSTASTTSGRCSAPRVHALTNLDQVCTVFGHHSLGPLVLLQQINLNYPSPFCPIDLPIFKSSSS